MKDYREVFTIMAENLVIAGMNIEDEAAFSHAMEVAEEYWDVLLGVYGL